MEERLEALLAPMARALDAAEGQLDAAAGAEIVDEDLARFERAGEAQLAPAIPRPDAGDEPVGRAVGDGDRLLLLAKADRAKDGTEDLLLRQVMLGRDVADHGRRHIEAVARHVGRDLALPQDLEPVAVREVEIFRDALFLLAID